LRNKFLPINIIWVVNKAMKIIFKIIGVIGFLGISIIYLTSSGSKENSEANSDNKKMKINNSVLIDSNLKFLILDKIIVDLFDGYTWQGADIDDPNTKGSIFYAYDNPPSLSVASIAVVDVSEDITEPDISLMKQEDVDRVDNQIRSAVESGMNLTKWMSSHLNETENQKGLVTAYVTADQGKEWQYIALRLSANNRKIVVIGSFDISKSDELASPIFNTMKNTSFKN
jgi:hypothetical protein